MVPLELPDPVAPDPVRPGLQLWVGLDQAQAVLDGQRCGEPVPLMAGSFGGSTEVALVPALHENLERCIGDNVAWDDAAWRGMALWVDRNLPWRTVLQIIYTTGRAGLHEWQLVTGKPGAWTALTLRDQGVGPELGSPQGPRIDLQLSWEPDGLHALARGGDRSIAPEFIVYRDLPGARPAEVVLTAGTCPTVPRVGGRVDRAALRSLHQAVCAVNRTSYQVVAMPDPGATHGEALADLLAARPPEPCGGAMFLGVPPPPLPAGTTCRGEPVLPADLFAHFAEGKT